MHYIISTPLNELLKALLINLNLYPERSRRGLLNFDYPQRAIYPSSLSIRAHAMSNNYISLHCIISTPLNERLKVLLINLNLYPERSRRGLLNFDYPQRAIYPSSLSIRAHAMSNNYISLHCIISTPLNERLKVLLINLNPYPERSRRDLYSHFKAKAPVGQTSAHLYAV